MSAIVPHLDHVVINVADGLNASELLFRRLGFSLTARGHHSLGSSNHLAVFNDNYLELLGYEDANTLQRKDLWQAPLGLNGLVWKSADAEKTFQHLANNQLADSSPNAFYRAVRLNDGTEPNARFKTVPVAAVRIPHGRSFFCQHLTPELVWRAEWQTHPNAVSHISEFVISATDIQQAAQVYTEIFGQENLQQIDEDELSLLAGRARVRFISPQKALNKWGIAPQEGIQSAKMVGLGFATHSLEAARQSLQRGDIHFIEKEQRIIVPVGHGLGLTIAFTEV
ncbi:VOC family protein [Rouxiella sp. T17]|uniref:VOC family protein n=1 Tax=Rouxiella sp. T17 TaxID=3085684 RepID=UPI002FC69CA9